MTAQGAPANAPSPQGPNLITSLGNRLEQGAGWVGNKIISGIRRAIFGAASIAFMPVTVPVNIVKETFGTVGKIFGIEKKPGDTPIDTVRNGSHKAIEGVLGKGVLGKLATGIFNIGFSPAEGVNTAWKRVRDDKWKVGTGGGETAGGGDPAAAH